MRLQPERRGVNLGCPAAHVRGERAVSVRLRRLAAEEEIRDRWPG
jgi:hypothetical protein